MSQFYLAKEDPERPYTVDCTSVPYGTWDLYKCRIYQAGCDHLNKRAVDIWPVAVAWLSIRHTRKTSGDVVKTQFCTVKHIESGKMKTFPNATIKAALDWLDEKPWKVETDPEGVSYSHWGLIAQ